MTEHERYRGLLTISVLLDDILRKEHTMLLGYIASGDDTNLEWQEKHIAKLELSRQALAARV